MNKIINFLKILIIPLIAFLSFPFIISILNIFGFSLNKIILIIISSIIMLISGFIIGKKSTKKGFISGGLLGFSFIVFLVIIGLFLRIGFSLERFVYYTILLLSCILGSIIGINKKKSVN